MKKETFSILINAPREKVWHILWDDATYRQWTSVFNVSSYAVSDWKEGSKIQFLSSDGSGMYSIIAKSIPPDFMSFKHVGVVKNFEEQQIDQETEDWSGALENYTLKDKKGATELIVEMDIHKDHEKYFQETFPKALEKVKELAEQQD